MTTKAETSIGTHSYGKRKADGNLPVQITMELFRTEASLPDGQSFKFDSARPDETSASRGLEPGLDSCRKLVGQMLRYEITPNAKIVSFDFGGLIDDREARRALQPHLDMLPNKPLKLGDTWTRTNEIGLGGEHTFACKRTYEYAGPIDELAGAPRSRSLHKITATDSSAKYVTRPETGVNVVKGDMQVLSSKHTYLFDVVAGRVVYESHRFSVTGDVTISKTDDRFENRCDYGLDYSLDSCWRELE